MIALEDLLMFHELKNQGLSISAIARRCGCSRLTVRRHLQQPLVAPRYKTRNSPPSVLAPYKDYLRQRVEEFPKLSARRLVREIREQGYGGGYSTVTQYLRTIRPSKLAPYELRFETPPGQQAQVDFAQFKVRFSKQPERQRRIWLFSMVLGHSRWLWGEFCFRQDLRNVLRLHLAVFDALGGVPRHILYDRMKTAVIGEDDQGRVIYNGALLDLLRHYEVKPRACLAARPQTKGKVERPFSYIRQDFYLARSFTDLDDLNGQFANWRNTIANVRLHGTTRRPVDVAFADEQSALTPLPQLRYAALMRLQRKISRDGMVSVDGNYYSVPNYSGRRVEVHVFPEHLCIFRDAQQIARHRLVASGQGQRILHPGHRQLPTSRNGIDNKVAGDEITVRSLEFYQKVGQCLAEQQVTT